MLASPQVKKICARHKARQAVQRMSINTTIKQTHMIQSQCFGQRTWNLRKSCNMKVLSRCICAKVDGLSPLTQVKSWLESDFLNHLTLHRYMTQTKPRILKLNSNFTGFKSDSGWVKRQPKPMPTSFHYIRQTLTIGYLCHYWLSMLPGFLPV